MIRLQRKSGTNPLIQGSTGFVKRGRRGDATDDADVLDDEATVPNSTGRVGVEYSATRRAAAIPGRRDSASPEPIDAPARPKILSGEEALRMTQQDSAAAGSADGLYHGAEKYAAQLPKGSSRYDAVQGPANVRTVRPYPFFGIRGRD